MQKNTLSNKSGISFFIESPSLMPLSPSHLHPKPFLLLEFFNQSRLHEALLLFKSLSLSRPTAWGDEFFDVKFDPTEKKFDSGDDNPPVKFGFFLLLS